MHGCSLCLTLFRMSPPALERLWTRRASSLARRVNLGWWLERFNGLVIASLMLFALTVLGLRTFQKTALSLTWVAASLGLLLVVIALVAWIFSKRRFIGMNEGLVRLDDRLHLNNRLISASRQVGGWPEYPAEKSGEADFRWSRARALPPGLLAMALVAVAWFVPIPKSALNDQVAPVEPGAWEQMEDWLATLEDEELIDESTIEELENKIEELREQPEEEWFSHSSLEATDTLVDSLGKQLRDLASEMATLDRNISALKGFSTEMSEAAKQQRMQELEEALEALEGNGLAVNEALLKQLKQIDPSQLGKETMGGLSAEQMKALQAQLQKGSGALGSLEGLPSMADDPSLQALGLGEGEGMQPGKGGIDRGRGDAPLFFGDKEDNLGTSRIEQVTNEDFSKATIGEVLGLGETERELDKTAVGLRAGGAVVSTGQGGDAVSRETLRPDEQAVLKRYFK